MNILHYLAPLVSPLSALLVATLADVLLRLLPQARDRMGPLFGLPARLAENLEAKLNRPERSLRTRRTRGRITFVLVVLLGAWLEQNPAGYLLQRDTLEEFRP